MTTMIFAANVRTSFDNAIIDLEGEINASAEQALENAYSQAEASNPKAILLNFHKVEYINSTGIALIVGILAKARKSHLPIVAFGLSDHYTEIFEITRLVDFMHIAPDEVSAVA